MYLPPSVTHSSSHSLSSYKQPAQNRHSLPADAHSLLPTDSGKGSPHPRGKAHLR